MLTIFVEGASSPAFENPTFIHSGVTLSGLVSWAQEVLPNTQGDFYFIHNGKRILDDANISDGVVRVVPRLLGGKGGFGSMLRAIGAQIEKTTNREACRDLSGRRLRDINEEKRLKNWINKKADREREALERKQKKLDKLRSEPKIEFSDKKYEEERSKLSDVVHDAVEKGFQASTSKPGSSGVVKKPTRKGFMLEEEEFSDDSVDSSDDQSETEEKSLKRKASSDSDEPSPAKRHIATEEETSDSSCDSSGKPELDSKTVSVNS